MRANIRRLYLAGAGLKRMDFGSRIRSYLSVDECLPSAGQGALGIECREGDEQIIQLIAPLNDPIANNLVTRQSVCVRRLGGDL